MTATPARGSRNRVAHDLGKLCRRLDGPRSDDGAGDARRVPLLTEEADHLREARLAVTVHHIAGAKAVALIHAHVERAVVAIREAAFWCVELGRAHTEIEEHTGDLRDREFAHDRLEVDETTMAEGNDPVPEPVECLASRRKRRAVTV